MYSKMLLNIIAVLSSIVLPCLGSLHHVLHHYEGIHTSSIRHHYAKRSADETEMGVRRMSLQMLGRQFNMELTKRQGLFTSDFSVYAVGQDGLERPHSLDVDSYYMGYLEDDPDSVVKMHLEGDDITARIYTREEHYTIEPSWRHIREPHNFSMVAYRRSDIKQNTTSSFCPHGHHLPEGLKYEKTEEQLKGHSSAHKSKSSSHSRQRRAPPRYHVCPMLLTADYRFYQSMGQSNMQISMNYLVSLVDRVDVLYKTTEWEPGYSGFQFQIKKIVIHQNPSPASSDNYNIDRDSKPWGVQELLEVYSKEDHSGFCLAHLFTYQDFSNGVLGLAYIGTPRSNAVGGICTSVYYAGNGKRQYLNTGLTTTVNWGRRVLTEEADLVTAHELGHNFGSEHDPGNEGEECAPGNTRGGNFLMYPASVTGAYENNRKFSICSKRLIGPVLREKSARCFVEPSQTSLCGNYRQEQGEQCDVGIVDENNPDDCCTANCRLKPGTLCSDKNSVCCDKCYYAPPSKVCSDATEQNAYCKAKSYCTGRDIRCPAPPDLINGTPCIDNGTCVGGECRAFCEVNGFRSCICSALELSCYFCCVFEPNGECMPFHDRNTENMIPVPDGKPCDAGSCIRGHCESETQDLIARFFDVFEGFTISTVGRIIKDNVVGATLIISLLIWIPCSCLVHYVDKKRANEIKQIDTWLHPANQERILPEDKPRVRRSQVMLESYEGRDTEHLLQWWDKSSENGSRVEAEESL